MEDVELRKSRVEALTRSAFRLEYLTIGWNVIEAVIAVGAGIAAGSLALVAFGLDSVIEVFAASVVVWQLRGVPEKRERRALRLIGISFFVLTAYVLIDAGRDLIVGAEASESPVGIALAAISLAIMPLLGIAKRRVGRRLGNQALIADAAETLLCSYLSVVLLIGLLLNATVGWWWADPLAAIVIAYLAFREGLEAWRGDHDHEHGDEHDHRD